MRRDLADIRLAKQVFAPHYAAALSRTVAQRSELRAGASHETDAISEVLPGEPFDVLEVLREWAWGRSPVDGAVGYVLLSALSDEGQPALSDDESSSSPHDDFVAIAESLIGVAAKPGGRSEHGLNCSGLVFLALHRAGIPAPRFCDLQADTLGEPVQEGAPLQRGDLIYFEDHAAIMTDDRNLVHVTDTAVERGVLADVEASDRYGPVVTRKRIGK